MAIHHARPTRRPRVATRRRFERWLLVLPFAVCLALAAAPVKFDIPSQPAGAGIERFIRQSNVRVLYVADEVKDIMTNAVTGEHEPADGLKLLLKNTGLSSTERNPGWFVVKNARAAERRPGSIEGTVLEEKSRRPVAGARVSILGTPYSALTDPRGAFAIEGVPAGSQSLGIAAEGMQNTRVTDVLIAGGQRVTLSAITIPAKVPGVVQLEDYVVSAKKNDSVVELDPYAVEGRREKPFASGNMDVPRTMNDIQPYYIFDARTIELSGAVNVDDFLKQRLTMNATAQTNAETSGIGSFQGTSSNINLRGLGTDKTLILVNGRRVSGGAATSSRPDSQPDLQGIPFSAIERIEVLPGSASGIYGGGAIGGVVNIILKQKFNGGEVRATYDNNFTSDNARRSVSLSYSFPLEEGRTRVSLSAFWRDEDPIYLNDRIGLFNENIARLLANYPEFYNTPISLNPANFPTPPSLGSLPNIVPSTRAGTLILKEGNVALPAQNTFVPAGTSAATPAVTLAAGLLANAGKVNTEPPPSAQSPNGRFLPLGQPTESRSFQAGIRRQMLPAWELFADFSFSDNKVRGVYVGGVNLINVTVPAGAPNNPFVGGVTLSVPDPKRRDPYLNDSRNRSMTLGTLVQLPWGWQAEADYSFSDNRSSYAFSNTFDFTARLADINSGVLNVFVDTVQNPVDLGRYAVRTRVEIASRLHDFALRGVGPLPSLPWGQPRLTLGLEHRLQQSLPGLEEERYPFTIASNSRTFTYARDATTDAGYLETLVPLIKASKYPGIETLELQLSGRVERFVQDTGTTRARTTYNAATPFTSYSGPTVNNAGLVPYFSEASYKSENFTTGIKYQPFKELTFRFSRATAFIPPRPDQLSENPVPNSFPSSVSDPKNGGVSTPVQTLSGGNPNLKPQNSRSFNAGAIWQPQWKPLSGLRLNAEYYEIEQFDAIVSPLAQFIVDREGLYPERVVRNPAGQITLVNISSINLYRRVTEGIDLSADYTIKTDAGRLSLQAVHTTILHLKEQYSATLPEYDGVGYPNEGFAAKYKTNANIVWDWRRWTAGWSSRYFSSYKQFGAAGGPFAINRNPNAVVANYVRAQGGDTIPSQIYHDVMAGYTFGPRAGAPQRPASRLWADLSVTVGVRNVLNRAPPFDAFREFSGYYFSSYGDLRLRSYWVSVRKPF